MWELLWHLGLGVCSRFLVDWFGLLWVDYGLCCWVLGLAISFGFLC